MKILKALILAFLCAACLVTNAQESEKSSKYIYPIIESDSAFQNAILSQKYVVVDFWAIWCRPCNLFSPEYEQIAKKFHKKAAFYKLNIDKCQATVIKYNTKIIPVIIIFKNGKEENDIPDLLQKKELFSI